MSEAEDNLKVSLASSSLLDSVHPLVLSLIPFAGGIHGAIGITKTFCNFANSREPYGGLAAYTDEQMSKVLELSNCPQGTMEQLLACGILDRDDHGKLQAKLKTWKRDQSSEGIHRYFSRRQATAGANLG